jgi:hypothetical protein
MGLLTKINTPFIVAQTAASRIPIALQTISPGICFFYVRVNGTDQVQKVLIQ